MKILKGLLLSLLVLPVLYAIASGPQKNTLFVDAGASTTNVLAAPGAGKYYIVKRILLATSAQVNLYLGHGTDTGLTKVGPRMYLPLDGSIDFKDLELVFPPNKEVDIWCSADPVAEVTLEYDLIDTN